MKRNFRGKSPKSMKKCFKLDEYPISVHQGDRKFYFEWKTVSSQKYPDFSFQKKKLFFVYYESKLVAFTVSEVVFS